MKFEHSATNRREAHTKKTGFFLVSSALDFPARLSIPPERLQNYIKGEIAPLEGLSFALLTILMGLFAGIRNEWPYSVFLLDFVLVYSLRRTQFMRITRDSYVIGAREAAVSLP